MSYKRNIIYGELHTPTTGVSTPSSVTYYELASWTAGEHNGVTLTDNIIIDKGGVYSVGFSMSYTHSASVVITHVCVFVNDLQQANMECQRVIGAGGDIGSVADGGLITLNAGDVLDIRVRADKAGTFTPYHGNFKIERITA